MYVTRRDVLKIGGLGVLGTVGVSALPWGGTVLADSASRLSPQHMPQPFQTRFTVQPVLKPLKTIRAPDGAMVDMFEVVEKQGVVHILPGGLRTRVWGYNGLVPGPTIKVPTGHRSIVRVRNHLPPTHPTLGYPFTTSTHLHGSPSLPQYDGYASDLTSPGFFKDYHYPNTDAATTLWYHDHAVHHTAENAYSGLAAQYHIHDPHEMRLLPQGEFDVPLTIRDALFAADGSLAYNDNENSGLFGDVILVNGRPWPVMRVRRRVYRFRFLAAAISRSFRFQVNNGDPVTVVATDGGLMPRSRTITQWRQGTAERYEVLIDFRQYQVGDRVFLRNLSNPNNVDFKNTDKVMAFDVTDAPVDRSDPTWNRIPVHLFQPAVFDISEADVTKHRHLLFERESDQWTINGLTWQDVVNSNFQETLATPKLNAAEIWAIQNDSGDWFHPVHIHLIQFRILDRNGHPPFDYELGPKDTVYTGEDETVHVMMRFAPHKGRYMVHCHNLVHEDHDMMSQFGVDFRAGENDPNDPILAAPAQVDTLPPPPRG